VADQVTNASQSLLVGPTIELRLPGRLSVELDAIHRRIQSKRLTVLPEPLTA
jgi:hypothetical protein